MIETSQDLRSQEEIEERFSLGEKSFGAQILAQTYRIPFSSKLKKLVYDLACPKGTIHRGNVIVTRYRVFPLLDEFPPDEMIVNKPEYTVEENVFGYEPNNAEDVVEWYVNFADTHLFVAAEGGLFAQDEMQVAEHPILAHLKIALLNDPESPIFPQTRQDKRPTPILIRNVERRCFVKTDVNAAEGRPRGLYGNNFSRGGAEAVQRATVVLDPPTMTNLIAMAALSNAYGEYTAQQILDIFSTAYTSFRAAVIQSQLAVNGESLGNIVPKVRIHTGNWGTGAFGGDKTIMALLQMMAGWMAGIDSLIYHTFDRNGTEAYERAQRIFDEISAKSRPIKEVLEDVVSRKFEWGHSDGN
eukprot:TRINITY_DN6265_c0_g1_i2.p1 TRINITY_DN6265_c0_g1~~TRINITY_DN6265_c0_g1_i2.p1  ORF type:complete len:357 (-),score=93.25 TRINITY_DN6265_c0_g1_i2:33-1103(-)